MSTPRLIDGEVACVDLETTGGNALYHRAIEVGIVMLSGGEVVEEWSSLVNPGVRVPPAIAAFTGITNEMLEDAPAFADVAGEVRARLSGRLFVAHNARFDYGFLRNEFRRLGERFRAPALCTVKLSRRLYPEARRHNLDAVMERHGLACEARHRALGDARVLAGFLAAIRRERDPDEVDALVAELTREATLPAQLDPELLEDLPECPGVYRFYGEGGVLLYIGKGNNLRTRVLQHFASDHASSKEFRLSRQVQRIDWTETAGELGALLREARWVKELEPLHNRQLRRAADAHTIVLEPQGEQVRPVIVPLDALGDDWQEAHGLFRSRKDARRALDEIVRSHALCARTLGIEEGEGGCFAHQVGRCRGVCVGHEPAALHTTRVRLALARHRLRAWPFRGRVGVRERDWRGMEEIHVFDRWRYLGTVTGTEELAALSAGREGAFDIDSYRILGRFLDAPGRRAAELVEFD